MRTQIPRVWNSQLARARGEAEGARGRTTPALSHVCSLASWKYPWMQTALLGVQKTARFFVFGTSPAVQLPAAFEKSPAARSSKRGLATKTADPKGSSDRVSFIDCLGSGRAFVILALYLCVWPLLHFFYVYLCCRWVLPLCHSRRTHQIGGAI